MVIIRKITKAMWRHYTAVYFAINSSIHPESRRLYGENVIEFMKTSLGFAERTHTWELKGVKGEWTLCAGKAARCLKTT